MPNLEEPVSAIPKQVCEGWAPPPIALYTWSYKFKFLSDTDTEKSDQATHQELRPS